MIESNSFNMLLNIIDNTVVYDNLMFTLVDGVEKGREVL